MLSFRPIVAARGPVSHIRKARKPDFKAIKTLSADLGYDRVSQELSDERISVILESRRDHLWVLEEDNRVRGWIHLFIANRVASPSFAEIGGLAVASDHRRKAIGRELVKYAVQWAKKNGLKIRVRCNTGRKEALSFYRNVGFTKTKSQHVFEADL